MRKIILLYFLPLFSIGQNSIDSVLQIHGGIDCYLGYQLNDINQDVVPIYVSQNQLGNVGVNLALAEITYTPTNSLRFQFTPGFGSYMNANYSAESKDVRWIYESYAGIRTRKNTEDWLDVGIFSSPYTHEAAKSWGQTMYTRSIAPEYVPYYLMGIRYKRKINSNLNATVFVLNGWQKIEIQEKIPSLGTQVEYAKDKNYVSWTTYQGTEKTESLPNYGYRFFNELSWIYTADKFKILTCGYMGLQQISNVSYMWGQINVAGEYKITDKLRVNGRIEQYFDPHNIQIGRISNVGFNCSGLTIGLHAPLSEHLSLRLESKFLTDNSKAGYFSKNGQQINLLPLGIAGIQVMF